MDPENGPDLRPRTQALDALVRETISRLRSQGSAERASAMLFTGNWHQAFPALLVQDPVLEPVDKVVWMVVRLQARETGIQTAFPGQQDIARQANIGSPTTVARAIAILRITRWLSLCARVRDAGGRFRGNVYALHDEPLPLGDALHLDPDYMQFLRESADHHHPRVQAVGRGMLQSIDSDVERGRDVCIQENPMERRLRAANALSGPEIRRYFSFNRRATADLHRTDHNSENQHQILTTVPCGTDNKETTTPPGDPQNPDPVADTPRLIYSKRLNPSQRDLIDRYLETIPVEQRQPVLDELEGRIRIENQGAKAVYDEPRYVARLCREVNAGTFTPNLGTKVLEQREQRHRAAAQMRAQSESGAEARDRRTSRSKPESAKTHLAEMRKLLGIAAPDETKSDEKVAPAA